MTQTNTSLIRRICNPQDRDAWNDFVRTYHPMVRSYLGGRSRARGMALDDHSLDEVSQNVWIKLWQHSTDFDFDKKRGRFRTFLYAVTVNALTDFIRRRRKHWANRVELESFDVADPRIKPDAEWDTAYRVAIWRHISVPLAAQMTRENPTKWQSFEQYKLCGRKAKEVAQELGITVDLVYQNTTRVMQEARNRCLAISEEELSYEP